MNKDILPLSCLTMARWRFSLVALPAIMWCSMCDAEVPSRSAVGPRKAIAIKSDVQLALRTEATAQDPTDREAAARVLVDLLREVTEHPKTLSPPLRRCAKRLSVRLRRVTRAIGDQSMADAIPPRDILGQQLGVPAAAPGGGAGAGNPGDFGDDLVALIEETIQRDVWVSSGGPASAVYFQPVHALVIRAPQSVHEDVAALLTALRAAGP